MINRSRCILLKNTLNSSITSSSLLEKSNFSFRRNFFSSSESRSQSQANSIKSEIERSQELKNKIWSIMVEQANHVKQTEPLLSTLVDECILQHKCFKDALIYRLSSKLESSVIPRKTWTRILEEGFTLGLGDANTVASLSTDLEKLAMEDIIAVEERDPACKTILQAFLYFKGYKAAQLYRVSHSFWMNDREDLALVVQGRSSELFAVDIHPNARIGPGFLIDHATGVVIGQTAVIGRNCSFLHGVTLGGTGAPVFDRHPKLGDNVFVGCSSSILGNIKIGNNVKIGSGSIVVKPLPSGATAVGNPAKIVSIDSRYYTENNHEHFHLLHPKRANTDDVKGRPEHNDSTIHAAAMSAGILNPPKYLTTWNNHIWTPKSKIGI